MKQYFFFIFILSILGCKAQLGPGQYTTTNSKAISAFKEALKYYQARENQKAIREAEQAISKDANFVEPYIFLANVYIEQEQFDKAVENYKKSLSINPDIFPDRYYDLANIQLRSGKYEEAKPYFEKYLTYQRINPDLKEKAEKGLNNCIFALDALKQPVPFNPLNMGKEINSPHYEYLPAITVDEQTFLFTRNVRENEKEHGQEDFYISVKENSKWVTARNMGVPINTQTNEGAPSLSADGQLLFFAACQDMYGYGGKRKGFGSCDIFYTYRLGDDWVESINIGAPVNSKYWDTQPSFASDGKTLYFISNRPGGVGNSDIWESTLQSNGSWSTPVNLGKKVNTPGSEEAVMIHPDNRTLYFSSNGHTGMGGLDIYMVKKDENGQWGTAVNLGYPINTYKNESNLLVSPKGDIAYFSSDRPGGFGGLDIYQFELHDKVRPDKITYVKGKVYDALTNRPLGANFELIDLETAKTIIVSSSNNGNGEFLVSLPVNKNYALNVSKDGYLFYSENYSLKESTDNNQAFLMDVPLQPINVGTTVELKNIFFETNKFNLKNESKAELKKLIAFLEANKNLKIELHGHTDNVGDKKSNQVLSENRAKAVYDYLIANGISKERLSFKGYGDTIPKVLNDTPENRARNRRTEFRVIGK